MSNKFNNEILKQFDERFRNHTSCGEEGCICKRQDGIKSFLLTSLQRVREVERSEIKSYIMGLARELEIECEGGEKNYNESVGYNLAIADIVNYFNLNK